MSAQPSFWSVLPALARAPFRHLWARTGTAVALIALCALLAFVVLLPMRDALFVFVSSLYTPSGPTGESAQVSATVGDMVFIFLLDLSQRSGEAIVGVVAVWGWARALLGRSFYQCMPVHMFRDLGAARALTLMMLALALSLLVSGAFGMAMSRVVEAAGEPAILFVLGEAFGILSRFLVEIATLWIWLTVIATIHLGRWVNPVWGWRLCFRHPGVTILASIAIVVVGVVTQYLINQVTGLAHFLLSAPGSPGLSGTSVDISWSGQFGVYALFLILKTSIVLVALHVMEPGLEAGGDGDPRDTGAVFD